MNFRVGACALLVCLAGCSAEAPETQSGVASVGATGQRQGQKLPSVQVDRKASESVANAPDRGALIQYKNKGVAAKQEGAYTWYPIAMSEAHAIKAVVTGEMTVPAPDGSQIKLKYERHEEQTDGNWTWIGQVVGGDQRQDAILTFGEKAVFGTIPQLSGVPLSVQTRGGSLFAVQTDPSKTKNPNVADTDMMVPPALALRSQVLASAPAAKASGISTKAGAATTVDVAIGYTQGFVTMTGSASAAVTRLVNLIAVGNEAFNNSLITGTLRVVQAVQVNYADNTSNQTALEELTGVRNRQPITVPASLAPLRTAREQYGADLAILVRRFQAPENQGCGIAWLNGAGQLPIDPSVDDDYAFAVVSDGNDADGNNNYFCAPESLVHEVGHLMGSAHDRDNSKIDNNVAPGGANLLYGRYPYSFGMKTTAANGNFYTIMSYGEDNQNANPIFSNPLVLKCGPTGSTLACGVANQTDNARSLNQTIPVVATFRARVVPDKMKPRNDINGDGKSDVLWHNTSINQHGYWLMNGQAIAGSKFFSASSGYRMAASGDFNGDGAQDVVTVGGVSPGRLLVYLGTGKGIFQNPVMYTLDNQPQYIAIGDFNGDGKQDFAVSNYNSNSLGILLGVGDGSFQNQVTYATGSGPRSITVGDFDGDGRQDLAVSNYVGNTIGVFLGTGSGSFQAQVTYTTASGPLSVTANDFNGDGKQDLAILANGGRKLNIFPGTGAGGFQTRASYATDISPQSIAAGDFNGDGKLDVAVANAGNNTVGVFLNVCP
ncbi:MAG: hypothetical protein EOP02_00430 [Proteobacteria bacterium]|nr:MAG: hypothetical protein EOP02_00430 [Pseudomonadota bacterium]